MNKKDLVSKLKTDIAAEKSASTCPFCLTDYIRYERREAGCNVCEGEETKVTEVLTLIQRNLRGEDIGFLRLIQSKIKSKELLRKVTNRIKELYTI